MKADATTKTLPISEFRVIFRCACIAIIFESLVLGYFGYRGHWLAHPQRTTGLDESKFIETQMVELPPEEHLTSREAPVAVAHEAVISKDPNKGRKATPEEQKTTAPEQNVTKAPDSGKALLGSTHGPVAVFNPAPVIPSYLLNDDLKKTVVVEFLISGQGIVTPRLLSSSDNEELDAIAIATAKKWQFRPAEENGKTIDSKVRLRIEFEVH